MSDISNILLGLGLLGVLFAVCAIPILAHLLTSLKTLRRELIGKRDEQDVHLHPSPITVQKQPELVTREELEKLEDKLESISRLGEERGRRLHARIDPLVENTAFIKGQMEAFTESFRNFANMQKAKE